MAHKTEPPPCTGSRAQWFHHSFNHNMGRTQHLWLPSLRSVGCSDCNLKLESLHTVGCSAYRWGQTDFPILRSLKMPVSMEVQDFDNKRWPFCWHTLEADGLWSLNFSLTGQLWSRKPQVLVMPFMPARWPVLTRTGCWSTFLKGFFCTQKDERSHKCFHFKCSKISVCKFLLAELFLLSNYVKRTFIS